MKYRVHYMRPEAFSRFALGAPPTLSTLKTTHVFLRELDAASLEEVFLTQQAEVWSPNGEARSLIASKGLGHTSMSVGDVVEDTAGKFFAVAFFGFTPLEEDAT